MAHFCGFIKLIFLLLILARIPPNETRPLKGKPQANSDLIAGNEFLKLFMEHDQLDKDLHSGEYISGGSDGANVEESFDKQSADTARRSSSSRSLKDKGSKLNQAEGQLEDSKQVVKLVTSGSKIVFLEDYDENDAILDAEARDIDLKKEVFKQKNHPNLDDYQVVAVSVSSSSQRGTTTASNRFANRATSAKHEKIPRTVSKTSTTTKPFVTMTPKAPTATTVRSQATARSSSAASLKKIENTAGDNFINRSHKSEFSIEEVEPLTMTQHQSRKIHSRHRPYALASISDTLTALDSENSASTNIHNILAPPLQQSASARSVSMVTNTYHSGQRNMTINHDSNLHAAQARHKTATAEKSDKQHTRVGDLQQQQHHNMTNGSGGGEDDQLLPFQTVIYHDTKAGSGPQSRSISYSSISQNLEDLKKWQQSGILAEARRNVSESLKPMPRFNTSSSHHPAEPVTFYSQPSKMYSEPSKFYSEPAKMYSEPSKIYGEPEKFYSEPAKVYGQPSKFYSEPAKVYSQPAKVYSEPAKTYWPVLTATTTSTQSPGLIISPTIVPSITTTPPALLSVNIHQSSRKPAIVSRIAFGEAHLISSTTSTTTSTTTTANPLITTSRTYGGHGGQHPYSRTYSSHRNPSSSSLLNNENSSLSSSSSSASSSSTPSRRILFNLDRLPYDLLNAPEPSIQQQQLLELQKTKRPQQTTTYQQNQPNQQEQQLQKQQQQQQPQKQRHHINPCLESAVSSLFSSSTLSAHPALLKPRQQHSSLSDAQQHSNQNAKGLPNGDLVKCVAEISAAAATVDDGGDDTRGGVEVFATERSHTEERFSSTPEQNYETGEFVSVMTNGRANSGGIQGGGRNSFAQPTTAPVQQQHRGFKPNKQRTRIHFGTNVKNPTEVHDGGGHQHHPHLGQTTYNTHVNANADSNNNNQRYHTDPEYNQYDDTNYNDNGDVDKDGGNGGAAKNTDYDDGGSPTNNGNTDNGSNGDGNGDDDSKVAYIVEGHNYRKYRVEEETDDGFIVGEYGVVDHNDGNLRGVRYTADSTINRSLIQKALLTFLKLK